LARNGREWHTLLEFCGIVGVLLIDAQVIYDPRLTNDRLLLGVKGTISEMEVATFRERAQSARWRREWTWFDEWPLDTSKESMVVSKKIPTPGSEPLSI
jgi:hypothetical protein